MNTLMTQGERPFQFDDPRQKRIYDNLSLIGPGPAAFYKDACQLMQFANRFESTTHLVAHLLREIESSLRAVLTPITNASVILPDSRTEREEKHKRNIEDILKALEIERKDTIATAWLRISDRSDKYSLPALAHRDSLRCPRIYDSNFQIFWSEMEDVLDSVLNRFREKYLSVNDIIDGLLEKSDPTINDVEKLKNNIPNNPLTLNYFFDKCNNWKWLPLLCEYDYFKHPPRPERDAEGGSVSYSTWPISRYLARMASIKPEEVRDFILEIPDSDNWRVYIDLTEAALAMPPDIAAGLVEKAKIWARTTFQIALPERIGKLMAKLAIGGKGKAALDLAQALLEIEPAPIRETDIRRERTIEPLPEPMAHINNEEYGQILIEYFPEVTKAVGIEAFTFLCDLLEQAVNYSQPRDGFESPDDNSYIWRPAIEAGRSHDLKDFLASGVRRGGELILSTKSAAIQELYPNLMARPWRIFHRIGLHLLRKFPDSNIIAKILTNHDIFDDVERQHEYALLLGEHYATLELGQQKIILSWIEKGPDLDSYKRGWESFWGKPVTDEQIEGYKRNWQLTRLSWFKSTLPEEWKLRFDKWIAEFGAPEHPDLPYHTEVIIGPRSPRTSEDLRAMPIQELIKFLQEWQPSGRIVEASKEGLGREVSAIITQDPQEYALEAEKIKNLDPTYVRAFLSGFHGALKQKKTFEWAPILNLCSWIVSQPIEIRKQDLNYGNTDPDLGWSRFSIIDLLSTALEEEVEPLSLTWRKDVWEILSTLSEDPNPTPEEEGGKGRINRDPYSLCINSIRGKAMEAVIQYALWLRRHNDKLPDAKRHADRGFDEMKEIREVLEKHLNLSLDPSLAIHCLYGRWIPWLLLLDKEWAQAHLAQIFPDAGQLREYRDTAWETYIVHSQPYEDVLTALQSEYGKAIDRLGTFDRNRERLANPEKTLAEHIMTFYWLGKIKLDDPDGFITKFFSRAPSEIKAYAIEFIGRSLNHTEGEIDPTVMQKLKSLWESRLETAQRSMALKENIEEIASFGWWVGSKKIKDTWGIEQLSKALKITNKIKPAHMVIEYLTEQAQIKPTETISSLKAIIEGDHEGWDSYRFREKDIRIILTAVLQSSNQEARKIASNLINYLASIGSQEYRDLLKKE